MYSASAMLPTWLMPVDLIVALIWGTKGNKLFAAVLFILICIRHRENIARMIAGSEGRVLEKFKKEK